MEENKEMYNLSCILNLSSTKMEKKEEEDNFKQLTLN